MEEYTVEIAVATKRPLTIEELEDVAEIGGAASGKPGGRRLETTMTVKAESFSHAAARAAETIAGIVAGRVAALNVMTIAEHDQRFEARVDAKAIELAGLSEVAMILDISKGQASNLVKGNNFPKPMQKLKAGPVWSCSDVVSFKLSWPRKAGRPPKRAIVEEARPEA